MNITSIAFNLILLLNHISLLTMEKPKNTNLRDSSYSIAGSKYNTYRSIYKDEPNKTDLTTLGCTDKHKNIIDKYDNQNHVLQDKVLNLYQNKYYKNHKARRKSTDRTFTNYPATKPISRYDDIHFSSHFEDIYFCKTYCHCCKKHKTYYKVSYFKHNVLDKLLHLLKHFGYDSSDDFIYDRSSRHFYDPWVHLEDFYNKYYDEDKYFVFFKDHHNEESHHSNDCHDVCECCHDDKIKIFEKKRRKFRWLPNFLRYFIFGHDDHEYYIHEEYRSGRSLINDNKNNYRKITHDLNDETNNHGSFQATASKIYYHDTYDTDHNIETYDHNPINTDHKTYDQYPFHADHNVETYDHPYNNFQETDDFVEEIPYEPNYYKHEIKDHYYDHQFFDCSKCCWFCKESTIKIEIEQPHWKKKRWRRRKHHHKKRGFFGYFENLLRGGSHDWDNDDDFDNSYDDDEWNDSDNCCVDSSPTNIIIIVIVIAVIIIQGFSSMNVMAVLPPMIFFGFLITFTFIVSHSFIPIYFIPIFLILLTILILPVIFLFLLLPAFLFPVFFPFILKLNGTLPQQNFTIINSAVGSQIILTTTPVMDYDNGSQSKDYLSEYDYEENYIEEDNVGRQFQVPRSYYWKINFVLGSDCCLERSGCHIAVYTRSLDFYNDFILRILENLSKSMDESKFVAYRDAYQIGSLNTTGHNRCTAIYYCETLDQLLSGK